MSTQISTGSRKIHILPFFKVFFFMVSVEISIVLEIHAIPTSTHFQLVIATGSSGGQFDSGSNRASNFKIGRA